MMAIDEQTRDKLNKILETIEKRKQTFGKVLVSLAFSRDGKKEVKLCFGKVIFQSKDEPAVEATTYDYDEFVLVKKSIELKDAIDFVKSIFENQMLKFEGWQDVPVKASFGEVKFVASQMKGWYASSEWPMLYAYTRIDDSTRGRIPSESLSKLGLPLFPSGVEAINVFFELNLSGDWNSLESQIEWIIPDYRARIKNLRLAEKRVTVEVETREIAPENVVAKFYCRGENKISISNDLHIDSGKASYTSEEEPFKIEVHVFSALDGNFIDKRGFDYRYPSREKGIVIESAEAQLLEVIEKGENIHVEFKKELDNREFLETVVAFANTEGGTILLGVDDNCRVKGFKEAKDKIVNLISEYCDPPIEVQIDSDILVGGIPITMVGVEEGVNKPYILKDRGIFVRRGASDKQIKRTELDDIYSRRQQYSTFR
jgi:hypothetical protein